MTVKSATKVTTTKVKTSPSKRTSRKRTSTTSISQRMAKFDEEINPTQPKVAVKVTKTEKPVRVTKPVETPKKVSTKAVTSEKKVSPTKSASKPVVDKKPTELVKPDVQLITFNQYIQDFKNRVKIHNYEFDLFVKDLKKGYQLITENVTKFNNHYMEGYKNQFNL